MNDKVKKDLLILLALVIGCALCARYFAKGETLEEYANAKVSDSSVIEVADSQEPGKGSATEESSEESEQGDMIKNDSSVISSKIESASKDTSADNSIDSANDSNVDDPGENFYFEPLSEDVISRISGISYVENPNISLDELRYLSLLYVDFNGDTQHGEMICNESIAQDLMEIFYELYNNDYRIESIKLIDEFEGDDTKSMLANNTSCFNYRVVEGSKKLSNHAYGLAVDINPFYNPYITYKDGITKISPEGSEEYADRTKDFPYKIDSNDLAYQLFTQHGFKWGGNWNSVKDYQHFERSN